MTLQQTFDVIHSSMNLIDTILQIHFPLFIFVVYIISPDG